MAKTNFFVDAERQRPRSSMDFKLLEEFYGGVIPKDVILEKELMCLLDENPGCKNFYLHFAKKYYAVQFGTWHLMSLCMSAIAYSNLEKEDVISIDGATEFFLDSVCHRLGISYRPFDKGEGIHFFRK